MEYYNMLRHSFQGTQRSVFIMAQKDEHKELSPIAGVKVYLHNGYLVANSTEIAKNTGKLHSNVLKELDRIRGGIVTSYDTPQTPLYFEFEYIHPQNNQRYRAYRVTQDGLLLYLFNVQGYNAVKFAYINEFNRMKEQLELGNPHALLETTRTPISDLDYINEHLYRAIENVLKLTQIIGGIER